MSMQKAKDILPEVLFAVKNLKDEDMMYREDFFNFLDGVYKVLEEIVEDEE